MATSSSSNQKDVFKSVQRSEDQTDEDVELRDAVLECRAANSRRHAGDPDGQKFTKCLKLMTKRTRMQDDEDIPPHEREAVEDELREAISEYKAVTDEGKRADDDGKLTKCIDLTTERVLEEAVNGVPPDGLDTYAKMAQYAPDFDVNQCPACDFKAEERQELKAHCLSHCKTNPDLTAEEFCMAMLECASKLAEVENLAPESAAASHRLLIALVYKNAKLTENDENVSSEGN